MSRNSWNGFQNVASVAGDQCWCISSNALPHSSNTSNHYHIHALPPMYYRIQALPPMRYHIHAISPMYYHIEALAQCIATFTQYPPCVPTFTQYPMYYHIHALPQCINTFKHFPNALPHSRITSAPPRTITNTWIVGNKRHKNPAERAKITLSWTAYISQAQINL